LRSKLISPPHVSQSDNQEWVNKVCVGFQNWFSFFRSKILVNFAWVFGSGFILWRKF
jgi:hypothetical protein